VLALALEDRELHLSTGKGARAALVTTQGFRHVLEIGRQDIPRRATILACK
jgi:N-methylhydantoinase A/oxoprolinase/acetone carboxylase beta subunit